MLDHRALVIAATLALGCSRTGLAVEQPPSAEDAGPLACDPEARECREGDVWGCTGARWELLEECGALEDGFGCRDAECIVLCEDARERPSHLGCGFVAVDLDNLETSDRDVSRLDFGVIVGNPWTVPVRVTVERDDAPPGEPARLREVLSRIVPPLDHEEIPLPRRELDGSASGSPTHTALTSNAYRVTTSHPVTVVQANPLEGRAYSRDTSLLLPDGMLGERTTVIGWPQTLAHGDTPETDFDRTRDDEDARAFLTIVGVTPETSVAVRLGRLGPEGAEVVPGGPVPALRGGDSFELVLGELDVLNLETRGLNADFTGTVVEASAPVAVFVGSEASDVPRFDTYATRVCCADHLEEQLLPDRYAGRHFVIGRQHSRRLALARATGMGGLDVSEPEWLRVVAVEDATLVTSPAMPPIPAALAAGDDVIVAVTASFELAVTNGGRVHAMTALAGQNVIGVDTALPGGDPSLSLIPPVESLARRADVVVPPHSAFDFLTIVAPRDAAVLLDRVPLADLRGPSGEDACRRESTPAFLVHQCQLSFPIVGAEPWITGGGLQRDGLHTVLADRPVGVTVSGFHRYIGYAHPGAVRGF